MPERKLTEYQQAIQNLSKELAKVRREINATNEAQTKLIASMASSGADTGERSAAYLRQVQILEELIKKEFELLNVRNQTKRGLKDAGAGLTEADLAKVKASIDKQVQDILNGVEQHASQAGKRLRGVYREIAGGRDTPGNTGLPQPDKKLEDQAKKEETLLRKYGQTLESVQALRAKFLSDPRFSKAQGKAQEFGFDINKDLYKIEGQGTGVQRLRLANEIDGVNQSLSLFVDKAGNVLPSISRQFRTFSQGVVRDIGELAKWTIAMSVIYTPIQQLSNLMSQMVENQTKLADAQVAINSAFVDTGDVFNVAADAAQRSGEALTGVIDAFTQAYRATGSITDQQQRFATSTKLLNDSLVLSKLSTLDQAQSIDTLTAALLQSNRGLDQGPELINKWVRTSQIAYVGIDTLATGVAVLGDAAETVGLDVDHLNGLIAVLAQTSISGSKEVANTAKTLIGSYQSDKSAQELRKFGIAVTDATGSARPFLEVIKDISELSQSGVISEQQLARISLALGGGGTRRSKDVQALISNYARLNEIADESAQVSGSSGLAQEALAKKLDTVQTAATQLSNAFQSLAQTLGTDGGLLDLFKGLIDLGTGLVTILDRVTEALGKAAPLLYTFGIASLLFRGREVGGIPGSFIANTQGSFLGQTLAARRQPQQQQIPPGMLFAPQYQRPGAGIGASLTGVLTSSVFQSVLAAGIPTISNVKNKDYEEAGANVVGGIIGAFVGGPAGALIGSSIAEAFVRSTVTYETDFANLFKKANSDAAAAPDTAEALTSQYEQAVSTTFREYGKTVLGGGSGVRDYRARELTDKQLESIGKTSAALDTFAAKVEAFFTGKDLSNLTPERGAFLELSKDQQEQINLLNQIRDLQAGKFETSPLAAQQQQLFQKDQGFLTDLRKQRYNELVGQVTAGEIRPSAFQSQIESIGTFEQRGTRFMAAFGDEFKKLAPDINSTQDAYRAFLDIVTYGSEEQSQAITGLITDIGTLQAALDSWNGELPITLRIRGEDITFENVSQLQTKLGEVVTEAAGIAATSYRDIRLQRTELPQIVGGVDTAIKTQDAGQIEQRARQLQEQYLSQFLSPDLLSSYNAKLEDFTVLVENAGKKHFKVMSEIDQQFWTAAQKQLEEEGKITPEKGLSFQNFANYSRAQLESAAQRSLALGAQWQQQFGYEFQPTTQVVGSSEGLNLAKPLHADFKIMQLLLQELVDQGQKQLDGQYNIPEGATFWVPLTAAYYRRSPDAGGGGGFSDVAVDSNTSATERNTLALESLSQNLLARDVGGPIHKQTGRYDESVRIGTSSDIPYSKDALESLYPTARSATDAAGLGGTLRDLFQNLLSSLRAGGQPFRPGGYGVGEPSASVNTNPVARLDLKIDSNTQLIVDGRTLANVIKPFLTEDLLKTQQAQGVVTRRFVL